MLNKIFKTNSFDRLFPALMPYIKTDAEKQLLVSDKDFIDKYDRNSESITTFLYEVNKNYKNIEVKKMIKKYIISSSEKELREVILLYLNLNEEDKKDKSFFVYFDETHGLVEKTEEELNEEHRIDREYNNFKTGLETFHGIKLDELYQLCPYPERKLIISILKNKGGWEVFTHIFEQRYHANFKQLITLLTKALVDGDIMNEDVKLNLDKHKDDDYFEELVFQLLSNHNLEIAKHIKTLIKNRRYDLIIDMIEDKLIGDEVFINTINQEELDAKDLITKLETMRVKRPINN